MSQNGGRTQAERDEAQRMLGIYDDDNNPVGLTWVMASREWCRAGTPEGRAPIRPAGVDRD